MKIAEKSVGSGKKERSLVNQEGPGCWAKNAGGKGSMQCCGALKVWWCGKPISAIYLTMVDTGAWQSMPPLPSLFTLPFHTNFSSQPSSPSCVKTPHLKYGGRLFLKCISLLFMRYFRAKVNLLIRFISAILIFNLGYFDSSLLGFCQQNISILGLKHILGFSNVVMLHTRYSLLISCYLLN